MTKSKRKSKINKKFIRKSNMKYKCHYIKDRAIINFILAHSKKPTIDFSKIKIPSFMDFTKNDFPENQKENNVLFNSNNLIIKKKENKILGFISPLTYTSSILNEDKFWFINTNNNNNESKIKSFLFN